MVKKTDHYLKVALKWLSICDAVIIAPIALIVLYQFATVPKIRLSKSTTYFAEPLAQDGFPDYGAILIGAQSMPPQDQNAAIPLLQATWGISAQPLNQLIAKEERATFLDSMMGMSGRY